MFFFSFYLSRGNGLIQISFCTQNTKPLSLVNSFYIASLSQWSVYQMIRLFRPTFVGCRYSHSESLNQGQGHCCILLDSLHVAYVLIILRNVLAFRPFIFLCLSQWELFIFLLFFQWPYTLSERKWNLSLRSHVNEKLILRIRYNLWNKIETWAFRNESFRNSMANCMITSIIRICIINSRCQCYYPFRK